MIKKLLGNTRRYIYNQVEKPAVILLYHRVTELASDPQQLAVSPSNFYEHIQLLKNKYNLLSIEEFSDLLLSHKKIPDNACIITFDDGYADNLLEAIPILESLNSQALFYITTSNLDTDKELWWDELERIILCYDTLPGSIEIGINGRLTRYPTSSSTEKMNTYQELHPALKYLLPENRNSILDSLRQTIGISATGRISHRLLTNTELVQLHRSPAAVIGAHTHNHPALSILAYREQLHEIEQSKTILEKLVNQRIDHFSYPFGSKKDYNKDSIRASRETGFKMVCANYYDQVHSWTDIFQVPRVLVRNWDKQAFGNFLSGCFIY